MRLPRILGSEELRPAPYVDAMAGARDFVHATSNQHGEKTAATTMGDPDGDAYRGSIYAKVRFTLDADDFEQWMTVVGRYPEWTPKMIKALQDRGHENGSSPYSWYARAKPLPLDKVVAVHTMEYPDNCWRSFDWSVAAIWKVQGGLDIMGIRIGDRIFWSERFIDPNGIASYRFRPAVPVATFAQANSNMAKSKVRLVEDDDGLFVELNGKKIAKRGVGRHARRWISLEPGYVVYGDGDLVIEQHGAALH